MGRWKVRPKSGGGGLERYYDPNDDGPDQQLPPGSENGGGGSQDSGYKPPRPDPTTPPLDTSADPGSGSSGQPRPKVGRWKVGPQGLYWDATDTGPDQGMPPPGANPWDQSQGQGLGPFGTRIPMPTPPGTKGPNDQTEAPPPAPAPAPTDKASQIKAYYQKYLGRDASASDLLSWMGNPNAEEGIKNSPEAKAHAAGQPYTRAYDPMAGWDTSKLNDPSHHGAKYDYGRAVQEYGAPGRGQLDSIVNYYNTKYGANARVVGPDQIDFGDGFGPVDVIYASGAGGTSPLWAPVGDGSGGGGGATAAPTAGTPAPKAQTFSDPATSDWEDLLRQLVDQLKTPQPNWTPAQLELQQTQNLDPLSRARQAQKAQTAQQLSQRGIVPGSGIFESAMADIDQQFNALDTTARSNFAVQGIGHADQVFANNEQRMTNAVNMLKQIPLYADSRMQQAYGMMQDPGSILALLNQMQGQQWQQGTYNQQSQNDFYGQLMQIIAQAFG